MNTQTHTHRYEKEKYKNINIIPEINVYFEAEFNDGFKVISWDENTDTLNAFRKIISYKFEEDYQDDNLDPDYLRSHCEKMIFNIYNCLTREIWKNQAAAIKNGFKDVIPLQWYCCCY